MVLKVRESHRAKQKPSKTYKKAKSKPSGIEEFGRFGVNFGRDFCGKVDAKINLFCMEQGWMDGWMARIWGGLTRT